MSDRPVSVAYITSDYPYVSHTFVLREVEALRTLGAQVHTFAVRRSAPEDLRSAADRAAFATTSALRPVAVGDLVRSHLRALRRRPLGYAGALRKALAMAGPDPRAALWGIFYFVQAVLLWDRVDRLGVRHVHAHFANVASDLAMLAATVGGDGWSWSFTMHGPTEFGDVSGFHLAEKTRDASFVVCISDFCRSQLMALVEEPVWERLTIVHCGLDPERFPVVGAGDPVAGGGALRVLCVARLAPVKGHAVLLEALAAAVRDGADLHLTLVGDGPSRGALERLTDRLGLSDRVDFAGAVGQDDIHARYAQADVFALPSFAEGLPVVLMEAMSCGLPVIASRIAGIPELVVDGVNGLLTAPGRVDDVVAALGTLAADRSLGRRLGLAGRATVEGRFVTRDEAERLLGVFAERIG